MKKKINKSMIELTREVGTPPFGRVKKTACLFFWGFFFYVNGEPKIKKKKVSFLRFFFFFR